MTSPDTDHMTKNKLFERIFEYLHENQNGQKRIKIQSWLYNKSILEASLGDRLHIEFHPFEYWPVFKYFSGML